MQRFLRFVNQFSNLFCCVSVALCTSPTSPADPATLASAALQRRVVLRGGEY
jgi:hypothetical protein